MLVALAALLASCGGGDDEPDQKLHGKHLTIFASAPQHGPLAALGIDVLRAEQLAYEQGSGRIGRYATRLVALDSAPPLTGWSDPATISENARRAASNPGTVAYVGEVGTGSSAISIPLLNEAGILQVSPLDTAMAFTTGSLAVAGSPIRFYPRLQELGRTFARVVPSDRSQVDALLAYMRRVHVQRLAIVTDEDPSGRAIATLLRTRARAAGIAVVAREEIDIHDRDHADEIATLAEAQPDALLDATGARPGAARLWRELVAADPALKLFAPASLMDPGFVAGLGSAASAAHATRSVLDDPAAAPTPAVRRFERAFRARWGSEPAPEAAYGYEAMRSVLAAIRRAVRDASDGLVTRSDVVQAYFETAPRDSVLGAYAIDPRGDTSLVRWGAYRVAGGGLAYVGELTDERSAER